MALRAICKFTHICNIGFSVLVIFNFYLNMVSCLYNIILLNVVDFKSIALFELNLSMFTYLLYAYFFYMSPHLFHINSHVLTYQLTLKMLHDCVHPTISNMFVICIEVPSCSCIVTSNTNMLV